MFVKHCRVEVYFIEFELAHNDDLTKIEKRKFSKADTIGERENFFCFSTAAVTAGGIFCAPNGDPRFRS